MRARRVTVVTGTRAEYGLLVPVIKAIDEQAGLKLQLVVTGMHLARRFGMTVRQIEADGWRIDRRVPLQGNHDDAVGQSRRLGKAITGLTDAFSDLKTDIVLVLGDRLEMFAAAAAATASQLVLGHIHAGDAAVGVQDDAYRHAISKLAHLLFAASAQAKQRLLRMGEQKFRIYQTGSPAIDNLSGSICTDVEVLSKWAGFDVRDDFLLVAQHPAGGTAAQEARLMRQTLAGCVHKDLRVLVLHPNCDPGFSGIADVAEKMCRRDRWHFVRNLPRPVYLGLLGRAAALVGNSSSGLIEAGYVNVDVLNVGPRQDGRERCVNVCDVDYGRANVSVALGSILQGRTRRPRRSQRCGVYGSGKSGRKIAAILAGVKLDRSLRQKSSAY